MLLCLSASHLNADFDLLERLSLGAANASAALVERGDIVTGAVVLATCNRFEAYLDVDEPVTAARAVAVEAAFEALADASGVSTTDLRDSIAIHCDDNVAEHLFAVTSGLESVVVGEDEISGQVARALESARSAGMSSPDLEKLFQRAAHTAKGVRNSTALGGTHRSLVRLALDMASTRVGDWADERVLVVGTGRYAATTITNLKELGAHDLRTYSPSGRGAAFALRHGTSLESMITDALADATIIITCTTALAINRGDVLDDSHHLVIDLGLPRNVEPAVGSLPNIDLLDLETIRLHAPLDPFAASDDARELVGAAAARFRAESQIEPAIVAFRTHVMEVLEAELARARKRGDTTEQTEAALRHLAGVLVHEPSVRARELANEGRGEEFAQSLETVFGIRVESSERTDEQADTA